MRRRALDPLPHVEYVSATTLRISPKPGHGGVVSLTGGGQVEVPDAGITVDTTSSGANGINASSTFNNSDMHYLYLYDSGGTAVATIDNTGPISGGPYGISNYRYIAPVLSSSTGTIAPFSLLNGRVTYSTLPPLVFDGNTHNPTAGTWVLLTDLVLTAKAIPETAVAFHCNVGADNDSGKQQRYVMATDFATPSYTPLPNNYDSFVNTFTATDDSQRNWSRWMPVTNGKLWNRISINSAGLQYRVAIDAFIDGHLIR